MTEAPLHQPLWQGPYHPTWFGLTPGTWLRFTTPEFSRVGQLEYIQGISAVVKFQGIADPTVLPDGYAYWCPFGSAAPHEYSLVRTTEPKLKITDPEGDFLSVRQAAAILGTTPKDIRRLLRSGGLPGRREQGTWVVATDAASLSAHRAAASRATDS